MQHDDFLKGYLEAIEFTLDEEYARPAEFSPDAITAAKSDCDDFWQLAADHLAAAYATGYTEEQAGIDFWFTRNGHGTGYWDRGLTDIGTALTRDAKTYGESWVYEGDDGLIYVA